MSTDEREAVIAEARKWLLAKGYDKNSILYGRADRLAEFYLHMRGEQPAPEPDRVERRKAGA